MLKSACCAALHICCIAQTTRSKELLYGSQSCDGGSAKPHLTWQTLAAIPGPAPDIRRVLSELAPASIACALERAMTSDHAASRMASTVMVRRRNWSLRQSAGTCWWWRGRGGRTLRSSSYARQNRAADLGHLKPPHGSIAAFDAAVILLQPVVQVATGPVP